MDPIRIFVGTDRWQRDAGAELVLEHTIRSRSRRDDIEITWMRSGDPGWEVSKNGSAGSWRVGEAVNKAWPGGAGSWGTPFTGFRFAVPELCNFEGKAIYLDADMLVLDDIEELWNEEVAENCGLKCWGPMRTDVSVFDCSWWSSDGRPWMSIKEMKPSGWNCMAYLRRIHQLGGLDHTLDRAWNDCDGHGYGRGENVKLVHYTHALSGQPYRPYDHTYPDEFPYVTTSRKAGLLWWDTYLQALIAQHGEEEGTRIWNEAKA